MTTEAEGEKYMEKLVYDKDDDGKIDDGKIDKAQNFDGDTWD